MKLVTYSIRDTERVGLIGTDPGKLVPVQTL